MHVVHARDAQSHTLTKMCLQGFGSNWYMCALRLQHMCIDSTTDMVSKQRTQIHDCHLHVITVGLSCVTLPLSGSTVCMCDLICFVF